MSVKTRIESWVAKLVVQRGLKWLARELEGSTMLEFLRGKKSYLVGAGWMLWGVWTYVVEGDPAAGIQRFMEGFGLITLRAGVTKVATAATATKATT